MEIILDMWAIAFIIVGVSSVIMIPKIRMNRAESFKQIKANHDKIRKSQDEYIEELQDSVKHYKNKASNMERGPKVEGNMDEIGEILPDLVSQFAPFAPKWLKPLLGNPQTQAWIIEFAKKNPEKVQGMLSKMVKGKNDKSSSGMVSEESEISV